MMSEARNLLCSVRAPAGIEHLLSLIDTVGECAKSQGLSDKRTNEIKIAVEEALVNIFNYAYQGKERGDVEVACMLKRGTAFIVRIKDKGIPFDPLSVSEPDTTLDIDERRIGGIGIFLVKKLTDHLRYKREGGKNVLELVVNLTQKGSTPAATKPTKI